MIITYIILLISIVINCILGWYTKKLLNKLEIFTFGIIEFQEKLVLLNNHLETIYQLETFYGEPVIQNLIKHLKVTVADIKAFKDSFIVSEGKEEESVDEKNAE